MLRHLAPSELDWIYPKLFSLFPKEEIKPKAFIEAMLERGEYALYGYETEGEIKALALIFTKTSPALLDYFLVFESAQGQGLGSQFLALLEKEERLLGGLIVEAEALSYAKDEKSLKKRNRRLNFYKRLGYQETPLMPTIFGTTYTLLVSSQVSIAPEELKAIYQKIYQTMVPSHLHKENILIP